MGDHGGRGGGRQLRPRERLDPDFGTSQRGQISTPERAVRSVGGWHPSRIKEPVLEYRSDLRHSTPSGADRDEHRIETVN